MPSTISVSKIPPSLDKTRIRTKPKVKWKEPSKFKKHHFICFDGEGYDVNGRHQYIYLAAYDGAKYYSIQNDNGLGSEECFKFLISTHKSSYYAISVIYGGSYDSNMMLGDLTKSALKQLHKTNVCRWKDWRIEFVPRKYLMITHMPTKRTCMLWDVIGFFQSSFVHSLTTWLGVKDSTINKGKKSRGSFNKNKTTFIIEYCNKELEYFYALMERLWECLDAAELIINRWDGAGSIAAFLIRHNNVVEFKGSEAAQQQYYFEARSAYAGGRFELIQPGDYRQEIYNYDINSAYPYAMTKLPPFEGLTTARSNGKFPCGCSANEVHPYDLIKLEYRTLDAVLHPFFHRHHTFKVSFPAIHRGWHWGCEYLNAVWYRPESSVQILDHLHWHDNGKRPYSWVQTLYDKRQILKRDGDKAELAIKLGINSLYGKMVQQKGWKPGRNIPFSHQLYWGGWVTAYCRTMIYDAIMQIPDAIVAIETDGIFSMRQLMVPMGNGLGEWELKIYEDLTYVQSGMYFGTLAEGYYKSPKDRDVIRYRGLDKGALKREKILQAWQEFYEGKTYGASVNASSTRFRTLGTSLVGERLPQWRQWIKETKKVALLPAGKRKHDPSCSEPWGKGYHHRTLAIQTKTIDSVPYNVLWADTKSKQELYDEMEQEWEGIIVEN